MQRLIKDYIPVIQTYGKRRKNFLINSMRNFSLIWMCVHYQKMQNANDFSHRKIMDFSCRGTEYAGVIRLTVVRLGNG